MSCLRSCERSRALWCLFGVVGGCVIVVVEVVEIGRWALVCSCSRYSTGVAD